MTTICGVGPSRLLAVGLVGGALASSCAGGVAPPAASGQVGPGQTAPGQVGPVNIGEPPTVRVGSASELNCVLRSPFRGRVIVPAGASWAMVGDDDCNPATANDKPLTFIPVHAGVQLLGERGPLGSRPVLFTDHRSETHSLFRIEENDVRVEGLHLFGPHRPRDRAKPLPRVTAIVVVQDVARQQGRRIVIADNEIAYFTNAVAVGSQIAEDEPADYDRACTPRPCPRLEPRDAGLVRVERNYLHNNAMQGGGYGVVVGGGSYVTAEGNVFEYNNHALAADGRAYSGYVARFNYVLRGLLTNHAGKYPHYFDVHGTDEPGHKGGRAGTYFEVALNTFRGELDYAFTLRGTPARGAYFTGNVLAHDDIGDAVDLVGARAFLPTSYRQFNFHERANRFDADYSSDLATGDFDGDGRSDVFVANGTAWFFSRGGLRPWEFLHASTKRTGELGFADIDNDRVSDVLYRDQAGRLGYLKHGRGALVPLASPPVPVPMKDLRFGDFDGDRLTDIFFTHRRQWQIWYGAVRAWRPAQTSAKPIAELLFGEFDDTPGTDVAGVNGSGWAFSSAATAGWARLNGRLSSSFAQAVAADVDGTAKSDIVLGGSGAWRYSRDGRAALSPLRGGRGTVSHLRVGRFDGGPRQGIVSFGYGPHTDRLGQWRSQDGGNGVVRHSTHNMR